MIGRYESASHIFLSSRFVQWLDIETNEVHFLHDSAEQHNVVREKLGATFRRSFTAVFMELMRPRSMFAMIVNIEQVVLPDTQRTSFTACS